MKKLKLFLAEFVAPNGSEQNILLNILLLSLGATLSWIYFIYFTHWISIIHNRFVPIPQIPVDSLPTAVGGFQPEPLEMPFYCIGWIFIPVFTFINYIVLKSYFNKIQNLRISDFVKHLFLTLFILVAGTFISLYCGKLWVLNLTLFVAVAVFLLLLLKLKVNKWVILGFEFIISISIVCLLLFDPTFSFNTSHYSFYLGPVNDVLHGKTMLVDASCQYGLLVVYFLSFLFTHFLPFTYKAFSFFIFVLYCIYYIGLYFCFRYWKKSYLLAILGMFLIFLFNYFSQVHYCLTDPYSSSDIGPFSYPSIGPLRFGIFLIILALFVIKDKHMEHRTMAAIDYFILFSTALSLFWGFEVGVYIILAVFATYIVSYLSDTNPAYRQTGRNFVHFLKEIGLKFLILIVTIVLMGGIISLFTYARSGQMPDWQLLFADALLYTSGLMMIPMPPIGPYYLILVVYFITVIYLFINMLITHKKNDTQIVSFITFFGILQFFYYVGRSHPKNLYDVCVPAIILLVWFISKIKECTIDRKLSSSLGKVNYITLIIISSFISAYIALEIYKDRGSVILSYARKYDFIKKNRTGIMKFNETDDVILEKAKLIKEIVPDETKVALIANYDDTRVLINAGKTNLMNFYTITRLLTRGEVKRCADIFNKVKPDYLFIEDGYYSRNFSEYLDLTNYFILGQRAGLIVFKNKNSQKEENNNIKEDTEAIKSPAMAGQDNVEAHTNLGDSYAAKGLSEYAIKEYKETLRLNPDSWKAHNNLGTIYGGEGLLDEAMKEFKEALRLNPDSWKAHNNLGEVYERKELVDEAIKEYKRALEINPNAEITRQNLSRIENADKHRY
ncbi:MAG: tetratricopeptide repeat protein [bacterium]|nr:tetratricopeptide repeat protein [bacterium]